MADAEKIFNGTADFYFRYRPTYPEELIDIISKEIGLNPKWEVADIGSGTGILSTQFLEHGNPVKCVEPNDEMRQMSIKILSARGKVEFIKGTGENTNLLHSSVDLVACGQSFHWMDRRLAKKEFARILRGRKWVALVWNDRLNEPGTFTGEYESVVRRYSEEYHSTGSTVLNLKDIESLFDGTYREFHLLNIQKLTLKSVIGRYRSASYAIKPSNPRYENMIRDFSDVFKKYEKKEYVEMVYMTKLYLGHL